MVAADEHELAVGPERAPEVGEHGAGQLGRVALGVLAQLEPVAEDHEPVDARRAPRAAARAARGGGAGRSRFWSRGGGRRRRASALARRLGSAPDDRRSRPARRPPRRRLLARARGPVRRHDAGRPRRRRDQGRAARRRATTRATGGRRGATANRPTTWGSTATSARSRSTSATRSDRELARELGARADVLIESFRPGLFASWGLDGDTLRAAGNPRLVSCSITAFGSSERAAGLPGYDLLLQAMGGLMSVTGEAERRAGQGRRGGRRPRVPGCWRWPASRRRSSSASAPAPAATSRSRCSTPC